jgi:hypothetical protein
MNTKQLNEKFAQLTDKQKEQILKVFATNDKRTEATKQKEFERLEKIAVQQSYKGIFNIFNLIKKESSFLSIKVSKFQAVEILGTMNFNQFLAQTAKGGAYQFNEIWNFCANYERSNEGDKLLISERGQKINGLIMDVKNGNLSSFEALQSFIELGGAPFKVNAKGERKCTLTKSSAKVLFNEFPTLYRTFGISEYLPEIHSELTAISAEISADELETAK